MTALPGLADMARTATISDCGTYRYDLTRQWAKSGPWIVWAMLNAGGHPLCE